MRYLTAGESHGPCLTAIIEGLPAGLYLDSETVNHQLARRQKGYGRGARMAIERDRISFLSGLRFNHTMGSPLTLQVQNRDWDNWQSIMAPEGASPVEVKAVTRPRPGHADLAGGLKYGCDDLRNILERSSARETAIRVAAGAVARAILDLFSIDIFSHVTGIGQVSAASWADGTGDIKSLAEKAAGSPVSCADSDSEKEMISEIDRAKGMGDTLGGTIEVVAVNMLPGLGSHVHHDRRLDGRLAGSLMSIQAIKGVEIGIGFKAAALPGSKVHDPVVRRGDNLYARSSNNSGGIEGGISNGEPLILRVAMKPIPTLLTSLPTVDWLSGETATAAVERSDICAVPAAAVVAEAVVCWELAVALLEKFPADCVGDLVSSVESFREKTACRLKGNQR